MNNLSFAYFGTPRVSSETLATLLQNNFIPKIVISSPDAPRGRGLVLESSEVKKLALEKNLEVITPEKLEPETIALIREKNCDYAIVVAYGKIFPKELIELFPKGVLNIHYSLLPKYRGATPLESALLAGEKESGVTLQKMAVSVDAGDIITQKPTPIAETETAKELRPRLIALGAELLVETLPAYLNGEIKPIIQDASLATRAYKIKKEDGLLDLNDSAEKNWLKYRAYADSIGTYFFENNKRMKITSAEFAKGEFRVLRVIPEGKKEVDYRSR